MNTLETSSGASNVLGMLRKSCRFNGSCKVMLICIYSLNNKSRLRAASCGVSCVSHLPLLVTHSTDRFICIRNIFYFYCLVQNFSGSCFKFLYFSPCELGVFILLKFLFDKTCVFLNKMTPCKVLVIINLFI